jgi:pyrroline-5-carboxylate reductase
VGETTRVIQVADVVILGCKSTQYREIATALANKILISLLGGVAESDLRASLGHVGCDIFRVLPNVAALVGDSITLISANPNPEASKTACQLFLLVGIVHVVAAEKIEAAAVVTASGPAFFASVLESASRALVAKGFDEATAQTFAAGSMRSCSGLAIAGYSPSHIIKQVATVGGSTEKGLKVLEDLHVGTSIGQAIDATFEAAKKLGQPTPKFDPPPPHAPATAETIPTSMSAVVLKAVREIAVERKPVPYILESSDMIVKIKFSGLCGSYVPTSSFFFFF